MPQPDPLLAAVVTALDALVVDRARQLVAEALAELGDPGRLLTLDQAAARLACSHDTVERWISDGRLSVVELPSATGERPLRRIRQADLAALGSTTRRRSDAHKEVPQEGWRTQGDEQPTLATDALLSLDAALARRRARLAASKVRDKAARSV